MGTGSFFRTAKKVTSQKGLSVRFAGMEIDPVILSQASEYGLDQNDIASVVLGNFVLEPPKAKFQAIVANPPYIRHLRQLATQLMGRRLDGGLDCTSTS